MIFGEQYSGSKFVQIHGTAEIIEQPKAIDALMYWYKQVRGETQKLGRVQAADGRREARDHPLNIEKAVPRPSSKFNHLRLLPRITPPADGRRHRKIQKSMLGPIGTMPVGLTLRWL